MFDQILKDYHNQKSIIEKNNDTLKQQLKSKSEQLTEDMLDGLNRQVTILHKNQTLIDQETKELKNELTIFYKESQNWLQLYNDLNEQLKQLGDVVNWAQNIEDQLKKTIQQKNDKNK